MEPTGLKPCLVYFDSTVEDDELAAEQDAIVDRYGTVIEEARSEDNWRPSLDLMEKQRIECIRTYARILDQVRVRVASGTYNLDRWRRILHNMKPKKIPTNSGLRRAALTSEATEQRKKRDEES